MYEISAKDIYRIVNIFVQHGRFGSRTTSLNSELLAKSALSGEVGEGRGL
jgi:hypothetical protein